MDIDSCDKMSIDPAQKNRILWLDMANVLAMVCVVWFHIPSQLEMPIRGWEYICVNIPFFLLSGYSYAIGRKQDETFKSHLLTTLRTLYLPTIIFFTCFYLLWIAIGKTLGGGEEQLYEPLLQLATGSFTTVLATFWFVFCLITIRLVFFVLGKLFRQKTVLYLICCLLPTITLFVDIPNYYELRQALLFIPFFVLGYSLFLCSKQQYLPCLITLMGIVIYFVTDSIGGLNTNAYEWYEVASGLLLSVAIILLSRAHKMRDGEIKLVNFLRGGSLLLLATQNYIIGIVRVLLDKLTSTPDYLSAHIALKPFVLLLVYVITLPVIFLITRYTPFALGRRRE